MSDLRTRALLRFGLSKVGMIVMTARSAGLAFALLRQGRRRGLSCAEQTAGWSAIHLADIPTSRWLKPDAPPCPCWEPWQTASLNGVRPDSHFPRSLFNGLCATKTITDHEGMLSEQWH